MKITIEKASNKDFEGLTIEIEKISSGLYSCKGYPFRITDTFNELQQVKELKKSRYNKLHKVNLYTIGEHTFFINLITV